MEKIRHSIIVRLDFVGRIAENFVKLNMTNSWTRAHTAIGTAYYSLICSDERRHKK